MPWCLYSTLHFVTDISFCAHLEHAVAASSTWPLTRRQYTAVLLPTTQDTQRPRMAGWEPCHEQFIHNLHSTHYICIHALCRSGSDLIFPTVFRHTCRCHCTHAQYNVWRNATLTLHLAGTICNWFTEDAYLPRYVYRLWLRSLISKAQLEICPDIYEVQEMLCLCLSALRRKRGW